MDDFINREFPMYNEDFWALSKLAHKSAGIVLGEHKKNLVYGRISRRIRKLSLSSFKEYIAFVDGGKNKEFDEFLNTITTNLTSFFREGHHFDFLISDVIPQWEKERLSKVRIWSAGCSTGEEPYSIAMTMLKHYSRSDSLKILATDLDSNVLEHGRAGIYEYERLNGLDPGIVKKYFRKNDQKQQVLVKDELKNMITFNRLNLLGKWPIKNQFDVIFCRNVLIYFDRETQSALINRYVQQLKPGGYLIIGHSENVTRMSDEIDFIGHTIYQKRK